MSNLDSSSNTDDVSISNNSTETVGSTLRSNLQKYLSFEGFPKGGPTEQQRDKTDNDSDDIFFGVSKRRKEMMILKASMRPNIIDSKVNFDIEQFMKDLDTPIPEDDPTKRFFLLEQRLASLKFVSAHYHARHDQLNLLGHYLNNEQNKSMQDVGQKQNVRENLKKKIEEMKQEISMHEKEANNYLEQSKTTQDELNQKKKDSELFRKAFIDTDEKYKKMNDERMGINLNLKQTREQTFEIARERVRLKSNYEEKEIEKLLVTINQKLEEKSKIEQQLETLNREEIQIENDSKRLSKQSEELVKKVRQALDPNMGTCSSFQFIFNAFSHQTSSPQNMATNSHHPPVETVIASERSVSTDRIMSDSD